MVQAQAPLPVSFWRFCCSVDEERALVTLQCS
jgi:hypothetical protein